MLSTDRGQLTVMRSSLHQDRWIVAFREIPGRDEAETWRGVVLRAEPIDSDEDELWVHELVGAIAVLPDGTAIGTVAAVESNPASDLLVLDDGRLVPVVFVTDFTDGRVTVDPPEGLLDL